MKTSTRALAFLMFAAMLGLSSAAALAAGDPRCDESMRQALEDNARVMQVRDAAMAHEIITPPEPSAGLTCMDQAVGVTGRLGNIFSDRHDDPVPPANTVVFTPPLAYPDWGAGDFLVTQLNSSIMPMLGSHLGNNFAGTVSALLGATTISSKVTDLIGKVTGTINDIASKINGFSGQINGIMNAINTIQTIAKALNLPLPSPVIIGTVAALEAAQKVADQLMKALQSAMNAAIQPLIGQVMGEIMAPAQDIDCQNISKLWTGEASSSASSSSSSSGTGTGTGTGKIQSITGAGPNMGAPFVSLGQITSGSFGNGGVGYMSQLQSGENMDILDRALNNLTGGALSGPGAMPSWKPAPNLGPNVRMQDVLSAMKGSTTSP